MNLSENVIIDIGLHIGLMVLVFIVGAWLARFTRRRLRQAVARTALSASMVSLIVSLASYGIWSLTVMVALIALGFPATTIIAVVGIIVIILGIALQESLKDFAAAINFRLFHPFEPGDYIQVDAVMGTVHEILPFNTTIITAENKLVYMANSELQTSGLTNFSSEAYLRPQVTFPVSYQSNLSTVKAILEEVAKAHPSVLPDPEPLVLVQAMEDTHIQVSIRVTVRLADYWTAPSDLRDQVKARFDAAGIEMRVPQFVERSAPSTESLISSAPQKDTPA